MNYRPYLIIPKLIQQPTWGGTYIANLKGWQNLPSLAGKKIGQSYELFSESKLLTSIGDTSDIRFIPEIGYPDKPEVVADLFNLKYEVDYLNLSDVVKKEEMPLLIKINHSKGNSFQLHIKHGVDDPKWLPKAESWYFLEPGLVTFGIKKGVNLEEYKNICIKIDEFMKSLSQQVTSRQLDIQTARQKATDFIKQNDPHNFVNFYETQKYEVIDPSLGGIHHSWEEDEEKYLLGNVVYEVQEDVMDPISTIRCFDQGKIKDDGSVRGLNIDDYFKYLDLKESHNDPLVGLQTANGEKAIKNERYNMDVIELKEERREVTGKSFVHIFVRDGVVELVGGDTVLRIHKGFSAFIPKEVETYLFKPIENNTVVLKTYI